MTIPPAQAFGVALRQLRQERGFSLYELERRASLDRGYLRNLETGRRSTPPLITVAELARALELGPQAQTLLAATLQARTGTEWAEYVRLRATFPQVRIEISRQEGQDEHYRLPPDALQAFAHGYRDLDHIMPLARLGESPRHTVQLRSPADEPLLSWAVDGTADDKQEVPHA